MHQPLRPEEREDLLAGIVETTERVLNCQPVTKDVWRRRITDVYTLSHSSFSIEQGPVLYRRAEAAIENHVEQKGREVLKLHGLDLIVYTTNCWTFFESATALLNNLFNHFNSNLGHMQNLRSRMDQSGMQACMEIGVMAFFVWKRVLFKSGVMARVLDAILSEIKEGRDGNMRLQTLTMAKSLLQNVCFMDHRLHQQQYKPTSQSRSTTVSARSQNLGKSSSSYVKGFEERFLETATIHYMGVGTRLVLNSTCQEYVWEALECMQLEVDNSSRIVLPSTVTKLRSTLVDCFVTQHQDFLLTGITTLLQAGNESDLDVFYRLIRFGECDVFLDFTQPMEDHVYHTLVDKCLHLMKENQTIQYIDHILAQHRIFLKMIANCFRSNTALTDVVSKAFSRAVNKSPPGMPTTTAPDMLAKYLDNMLRKGAKNNEADQEEQLESCMCVFQYIQDKDIFMKFYAHHLAKRLIFNTSSSQDMEEAAILRMKNLCGHEYTQKLYRMITDRNLSTEQGMDFATFLKDANVKLTIQPQFFVLQSGSWPITNQLQDSLDLPLQLLHVKKLFDQYYKAKHNGRVLHWNYAFSMGELKTCYLDRPYSISMSIFQMTILLLYNTTLSISIRDISARTKLSMGTLGGQLKPLVDIGLLKPAKVGEEFNWRNPAQEQVLSLNLRYSNKRFRFKLGVANTKEVKEEATKTRTAALDDRKMWLQAAIVRIMKSRQRLSHQQLTQEVSFFFFFYKIHISPDTGVNDGVWWWGPLSLHVEQFAL
ncbi:cullin-2-like [Sycon ciliatum]|uniref:cullin-2-like n=1 Tax=Sycon ciliatum TaxID=27933 RepID=UPI0031F66C95